MSRDQRRIDLSAEQERRTRGEVALAGVVGGAGSGWIVDGAKERAYTGPE